MILNSFYEAIMARVQATCTEVKHFDLFFGQYETEEEDIPFPRQAVLLEYNPMDFKTLGNKKQQTEALFSMHVVSDVVEEVSSSTESGIRTAGHAHLALLDKLFKNLQGYGDNTIGFNSISRTALRPYNAKGMMIVHIMDFRTLLTDNAAKQATTPQLGTTLKIIQNVP